MSCAQHPFRLATCVSARLPTTFSHCAHGNPIAEDCAQCTAAISELEAQP
jgi:hypothetical protein